MNHARALAMGDFDEEDVEEDEEEEMDTTGGEVVISIRICWAGYMFPKVKQKRLRKTYKNQLMLSEWLVEVLEK